MVSSGGRNTSEIDRLMGVVDAVPAGAVIVSNILLLCSGEDLETELRFRTV